MHLSDILNLFYKYSKFFVFSVLFGIIGGILINYYYPLKFYAEGTLYVSKEAESVRLSSLSSEEVSALSDKSFFYDFTYDGFYAHQSAQMYTDTFIGIIISQDARADVLTDLNQDINTKNLNFIKRSVKAKKHAPQLIFLSVRSTSPDRARIIWERLVSNSTEVSNKINSSQKPPQDIIRLTKEPIIRESFRDPVIFALLGALLSIFLAILFVFGKHYLEGTLLASDKKKSKKFKFF